MTRFKIDQPCTKCGGRAWTSDRDGWSCLQCGKDEQAPAPVVLSVEEMKGLELWPILTEAE